MTEYKKPLPAPTPADEPYWRALIEQQLVLPRCTECRSYQWYPRLMCRACGSLSLEWEPVRGRGVVFSYTTQHHRTGSRFDDELPYTIVVVDLAEAPGVRMTGRLTNCAPEAVEIGLPVESWYEAVTPEVTFLRFRPVVSGQ
ncbi:MAG: OB-fold domain-containing protein [Chloroflexi bacterium]|nr:OB-fold domain-containing protein [Chloroflexota bacterium]